MADPQSGRSPRKLGAKRYLWLLSAVVPGLIVLAWILVQLTGLSVFWWTGPIMAFILVPLVDQIVDLRADMSGFDSPHPLEDDKFYRCVTYLYLPGQYLSLIFVCWLWSGGGWLTMSTVDKVGLMATTGIVGGIAINAAHELGHRRARAEKRLSKIALAQTGYGHFFVEHNQGHHLRVATAEDPASARLGESVYRFIPRSVLGGLRSAWQLETARLARAGKPWWSPANDILNAWLLTATLFAGLVAWFGPVVIPWLLGQAVIGVCLLETVNYLEHYGLRRQRLDDGVYEPVGQRHSWNSDTLIANVFLYHLQRHSDHHANPHKPYQTLQHCDQAPQLPAGYGNMLVLAWCPPLWRRVMDPRVLAHYGGDIRLAALKPTDVPRGSSDDAGGRVAYP
ncbi:alkane 1-monooxygenase [Mycolicibacterium diernhoferi]|uniref:Alkane 1-monooxygenase n=1 Tax=Mycolicibacterium diernhoferi TaxID=1801 RepID=A0A1Q4HBR7_9MYCO|nr:alkane 1-monooxygenase [Mycolicibacterium diernhoferi]OJZ64882.1 alkane 1-monooxygenase [Mycolicibacterium diernhoferi]OPE54639.1 alkane 1-monooxygenase [Mycolicibacterium diernhoferi]PEG53002.1 alkane 1-monooxygenase [Mycolicibacterium diernhoferi]QYL22633.1 alkane 1-monooxygenase [Mycolicibacterium diernhoferi]